MADITLSDSAQDVYDRFPAIFRSEDDKRDWPLKKWLHGVLLGYDTSVWQTVQNLDYTTVEDGGTGTLPTIVDGNTIPVQWMPWLAMMLGIKLNPNLSLYGKRNLLANPVAGYNVGTKDSIKATVQAGLIGTKYCEVYDHTTATSGIGAATPWDLCILVRDVETPAGYDPVAAVIAANQKPAGVNLWRRGFETPWSVLESDLPTWSAWDAEGSWQNIENDGL